MVIEILGIVFRLLLTAKFPRRPPICMSRIICLWFTSLNCALTVQDSYGGAPACPLPLRKFCTFPPYKSINTLQFKYGSFTLLQTEPAKLSSYSCAVSKPRYSANPWQVELVLSSSLTPVNIMQCKIEGNDPHFRSVKNG